MPRRDSPHGSPDERYERHVLDGCKDSSRQYMKTLSTRVRCHRRVVLNGDVKNFDLPWGVLGGVGYHSYESTVFCTMDLLIGNDTFLVSLIMALLLNTQQLLNSLLFRPLSPLSDPDMGVVHSVRASQRSVILCLLSMSLAMHVVHSEPISLNLVLWQNIRSTVFTSTGEIMGTICWHRRAATSCLPPLRFAAVRHGQFDDVLLVSRQAGYMVTQPSPRLGDTTIPCRTPLILVEDCACRCVIFCLTVIAVF